VLQRSQSLVHTGSTTKAIVCIVMSDDVCPYPPARVGKFTLNLNQVSVGTMAIEGEEYNIRGVILFKETQYDRDVTGKGESIMIYDPSTDTDSLWENGGDPEKEETARVPAGCKVRVIGAIVKFKRV